MAGIEIEEIRKGEITVFLSLVLVVLLSLIFTTIESARVSGARSYLFSTVDLAIDSVFAEYDRELLEQYEVFFLDGSYGGGQLNTNQINERFIDYISYQLQPEKGLWNSENINLWNLEIDNSDVSTYLLATDYGGEPFRQQAIEYMKTALGVQGVEYLLDKIKDSDSISEAQEDYGSIEKKTEEELVIMEEEKNLNIEQEEQIPEAQSDIENPLDFIKEFKNMGILSLVLRTPGNVSQKSIELSNVLSKRSLNSGTADVQLETSESLTDTALFNEYILSKCTNATTLTGEGALDYQVEYILGGKQSDIENLKSTVQKILLIREGANFLYLLRDSTKSLQAQTLATALVGAFLIPGLVEITKMAILLGWAYAESILDVRSLLEGGKVPIFKNESSWQLSLGNIGKLMTNFDQDVKKQEEGISYKDYLRILLYTESRSNNLLKCMDIVEVSVRSKEGRENFKLDHCIAWSTIDTTWNIDNVFMLSPLLNAKGNEGYIFSESVNYGYEYKGLQ